MRHEQTPDVEEITDGPRRGGKIYRHPAYGQIAVYRSHGGNIALYGSDFRHNSTISIEIGESEFTRDLSRDWPHRTREIVQLTMSEAQWATFVSSLNSGEGVQCTLGHVMGEMKPAITYRDAAADHRPEIGETIQDGLNQIAEARRAVEASGLSKAKMATILAPLNKAEQELTSNAAFVVESHSKAMEERVEKAKVEVNAYVTGAVMRAGIAAIRDGSADALLLTGPSDPA